MRIAPALAVLFASLVLLSCGPGRRAVTVDAFGVVPDGRPASIYTLTAQNGTVLRVTNFGGVIVSLRVPDRTGALADVVLGYDSLQGCIDDRAYLGAIIGRYGNRIARGAFTLDGKTYALAVNNGPNHLHGGIAGFNKVLWKAGVVDVPDGSCVRFAYTSADGEEGYPGMLSATVTYTLLDSGTLRIDYQATTDAPTVVNLTQHSYFNLAGAGGGDVHGHVLQVHASRFLPVDSTLIPTGELRGVQGTPFDFRAPAEIGARIGADDEQLRIAGGYDHTFVLDGEAGQLRTVARLSEPASGRFMEVRTTEPGMQFYSGNFLDGSIAGKAGHRYARRGGLCLETQHFPDSPNRPGFPSVVLRPGQTYRSTTEYSFGAK